MGFALAVQMLGSREDAADAVQDSLYQLVRKGSALDGGRGEARSWFLKVVRNRCIDTIRRRQRRPLEAAELEKVLVADRPEPGAEAENREELERLKAELMAMPDESREIVLLRDFHDLSYAEIAEVLSIPVGTVMSRLHRARQELRRRMEADAR
jgi:RNA polymerase sigma-70 factor (ECF subfamily)